MHLSRIDAVDLRAPVGLGPVCRRRRGQPDGRPRPAPWRPCAGPADGPRLERRVDRGLAPLRGLGGARVRSPRLPRVLDLVAGGEEPQRRQPLRLPPHLSHPRGPARRAASRPLLGRTRVLAWLGRHLPVTERRHGHAFLAREGGRHLATPLLVALFAIELSDIMFAVDSIPAVFAITQEPFIVFTSNVFAILGLRALCLVLADVVADLKYLHYGSAPSSSSWARRCCWRAGSTSTTSCPWRSRSGSSRPPSFRASSCAAASSVPLDPKRPCRRVECRSYRCGQP